jgi:signal transduction histidine kinase
MTRSLQGKLILSYLAVALLTVLVVSLVTWLASGRSLLSMVAEEQTAAMKDTLLNYYSSNGSLDGFSSYYFQTNHKSPPDSQPVKNSAPAPSHNLRGVSGVVDAQGRALLPSLGYEPGQSVPQAQLNQAVAVQADGQTIAWILPDTSLKFTLAPEEELFLQHTTLAIGLAALAGVIAAVTTGIFLARRLLKPIRQLTRASQALSQGQLGQQVTVTSRDELGQLSQTFNRMSAGLDQADQQRKRMTADITHDLSTPLQIIGGYVEMLEGGEVKLTPQRIEIIKTELGHLRRLVGDLSTLTQAEAGALDMMCEPVQPAALLETVYRAFQPIAARQGVELALDAPEDVPLIQVDEGRMVQVLKNLLENALRYCPAGGTIRLSARGCGPVELRVQDSGEGIAAEDLPYVFERFYRADPARGGSSGKMGLGLAICKALVTAQGGTIKAESDGKGKGTTIIISFMRNA